MGGADNPFFNRFGPRALVLGGSEGLGYALARALADRGLDLILTGRRPEVLDQAARDLAGQTGRDVTPLVCDLASDNAMEILKKAAGSREIGLLVYNAALAPSGPFLGLTEGDIENLAKVNVLNIMICIKHYGSLMAERKRGGILLMGSLASLQGSGWLAGYAATKSFIRVFGESLWAELEPEGIRVLTCVAGATGTPNFKASGFAKTVTGFPPVLTPEKVAETAVKALNGTEPLVIPGFWNRFSARMMAAMPKRMAIRLMSDAARRACRSY
jgi:short-subunit dehydrogenase